MRSFIIHISAGRQGSPHLCADKAFLPLFCHKKMRKSGILGLLPQVIAHAIYKQIESFAFSADKNVGSTGFATHGLETVSTGSSVLRNGEENLNFLSKND